MSLSTTPKSSSSSSTPINANTTTTTNIAKVMDDLKAEDVLIRIDAFSKLDTIAIALGPSRSRQELLPFLQDCCHTEDDEVLVILAEQLNPNFYSSISSGQQQANDIDDSEVLALILGMLETLAGAEECLVRNAAVANLQAFIKNIPMSVPLIRALFGRLAQGDWFTTKVSACALLPHFANFDDFDQLLSSTQIIVNFAKHDDSPMVRRAALPALSSVADYISHSKPSTSFQSMMMDVLRSACKDPQDSVRLLSVPLLVATFPLHFDQETERQDLTTMLGELAGDNSWRVRFMVAGQLGKLPLRDLTDNVGELWYTSLLEDVEPEVRAAAAGAFGDTACALNSLNSRLIAGVQRCCQDSSVHVRAAIATQLNQLSEIAGPTATRRDLLPLLETLMRDDDSSVRLNVMSRLDTLNQVIGVKELASSLLPAIRTLATDKQWRVRQACLTYFPVLCQHVGPDAPELIDLIITWLLDPVYIVRCAAADSLLQLRDTFGDKWMKDMLIPALTELILNATTGTTTTTTAATTTTATTATTTTKKLSYLKRISLGRVVTLLDPQATLFPDTAWITLLNDPIANVRMTVTSQVYDKIRLRHPNEVMDEGDMDVLQLRQQQSKVFLVTTNAINGNN